MTRRNQLEAQLQHALIEYLRWGARGDTWWTHVPTGGWRSPIEAAIFKSLGVRAGLLLVEADEITLDEALEGLVEPICDCQRWPLAAQWERTHPHRRDYRRRRGRT